MWMSDSDLYAKPSMVNRACGRYYVISCLDIGVDINFVVEIHRLYLFVVYKMVRIKYRC